MHPPASWYASGIRWIALGLLGVAGFLDRPSPSPWPLEARPAPSAADDPLLEARLRASRGI